MNKRSRIIAIVVIVLLGLLLIGPRCVDGYVDWLWFSELRYRSVFLTVLITRLAIFIVTAALTGMIIFASLAVAYFFRPAYVVTHSLNDPSARYRAILLPKKLFIAIGIPICCGIIAGIVSQSYWDSIQLFFHGTRFGITDPQFGYDLGFYAFHLPFYRLVVNFLFVTLVLATLINLLTHYVVGGLRLSAKPGFLTDPARIQLTILIALLVLLKALSYWLDRYELLSHTRFDKPFTGAGYTDINAVLPAKIILLIISLICVIAVFSALVLRNFQIPAIGLVLLLVASLIIGSGWPLIVEQFSVKPNAAQKEREYITRSITATRQAYNLTDQTVTYRNYDNAGSSGTISHFSNDSATISNIRLLDPSIVSPAFTQFQQGKNFYYFPDKLSIDRYFDKYGHLRDYVVAARELNPNRLIDNQRDWINRHTVYTHGNGFIASPANTVRGIANDPNQNGGYPEFLVNVVAANDTVRSEGPAPLDQPRIYYGPVIASAPADYAIVGRNGSDREYDYETNTQTRNYTYTGAGGVNIGNWFNRGIFAAKFAERNFLFSSVIGPNSKILFNRDPISRVRAAAPWLTTDSVIYPAVVNKRLLWIIDGYTTLDNYPYSASTLLSTTTPDGDGFGLGNLLTGRRISYIRNSVKATVDAYDGTVTLYQQDEHDPVLQAWMKVFPHTVHPKTDISSELAAHLRYPEDLFRIQRTLLAKYHVNNPVEFFAAQNYWDVPKDPNKGAAIFQPPYYIVAKNVATNTDSASFQLTSAMNRLNRDFLAAYISASSDPETYGKITVLTLPGEVKGPILANNAITTDTVVSQDLGVIGRDNQNHIHWGNLLTLPIGQGGLLYVEPVYASPGSGDSASSYPRLIRIAMMYNDKIGYGPTVGDALTHLFGPDAAHAATGIGPTEESLPQGTTSQLQTGAPSSSSPSGTVLSPAKAAALRDIENALRALQEMQHKGDFADYGAALQKLNEAITKYNAIH